MDILLTASLSLALCTLGGFLSAPSPHTSGSLFVDLFTEQLCWVRMQFSERPPRYPMGA